MNLLTEICFHLTDYEIFLLCYDYYKVTCSNQRDPLVDDWRVQRITLNGTARYTCRSGYRSKDGANMATCTRDGWRPNPLCQATTCGPSRDFETAEIQGNLKPEYSYNERVEYVCKSGYTGRFNLKCGQTGWLGQEQCRGKKVFYSCKKYRCWEGYSSNVA
uniref:Sushi domain-containing protein n=1 Tax=Sparus aurata TaxID=8175 RepID=A0A671VW16_SPAAU